MIASQTFSHYHQAARHAVYTPTRALLPRCLAIKPDLLALSDGPPAPGDLFALDCGDARYDKASRLYFETVVVKRKPKLLCQGQLFSLDLEPEGSYPKLSEPFVKHNPVLLAGLERIRKMQKNGEMLSPRALLVELEGSADFFTFEKLDSLADMTERLKANPGMWTDGTGPNDAPLSEHEQALLTAGELVALAEGLRGVALLQVSLINSGSRLPLLRPFVLTMLKALSEDAKRVVMLPSKVEGATSLVVSAKRQPYLAYARYLADLGCQASLVADSDFYKMIIGLMMGYKMEHVEHHIAETTGRGVDPRVRAAVQAELRGLSTASPTLPWK